MNSIISWIGGKKALRELIYQRFPLSYGRYIEVFGGGGWVLFGKPPDGMDVYNDYNSDLTNLFRCVRDRPLALIQELGFFPLNGREEFDYLKRFLNREEFMAPGPWYQEEGHLAEQCLTPEACGDIRPILEERARMYDVKRAACFYQLIRYSYGSSCTSYGSQPFDIRRTFGLLWEGSRRLPFFIVTRPITKQRDITKWCSAGRTMCGSVTCLGVFRENGCYPITTVPISVDCMKDIRLRLSNG